MDSWLTVSSEYISFCFYFSTLTASPRGAEYCDNRVCLSVCPQEYLHVRASPKFLCMLRTSPVLLWRFAMLYISGSWMTSCLYIMASSRRHISDSIGSSVGLSPWRILKLVHQGAAPDRERSLTSTITLYVLFWLRMHAIHVLSWLSVSFGLHANILYCIDVARQILSRSNSLRFVVQLIVQQAEHPTDSQQISNQSNRQVGSECNVCSIGLCVCVAVRQLSKTIQCTCCSYGGVYDYDQSWICVL